MGLKHGGYCTGCCWSVMALLFVAGVMNLLWVGTIAGFVLLEKVAPAGHRMGQAAGVLMVAGGVVLLGLAMRRPGIAGYEPFATLFDFRGSIVEVVFLLIIILASLLMYRPFCNYLCPLDPVYDFIAEARRWVREGWQVWKKRTM